MKSKFIFFLLLFKVFSSFAQNSISIAGFGDFSYSKDSTAYQVNMGNLGVFNFTGTIQPLNLEAKVTTQQLKEFPGFVMIEALELDEITLKLSPNSLRLEGQADTKKKLKMLCEAFNIQSPFIKFIAQINPTNIDLNGELDFLNSPITVDVSREIGTRFILEKMNLFATLGYDKSASPSLALTNNMKIRPTHHDKDLTSVMKLSYNLLTSEILGIGTMNDTWQDPFGMSKSVGIKSDAIAISNSTITIGWIPATTLPVTLGFATEKANLFKMEFLAKMVLSLTKQQVALQATRNKMEMKDFVMMLKDGFGLKIPNDLFPENLTIQEVMILFSPIGGSVEDNKIAKGFLYKGGIQYAEATKGDLFFKANSKDSISFDMNMEGFEKILEAKINSGKETELEKALKQAFATLQIKKMQVHLEADKNMNLVGLTQCTLVVFGKEMNFNVDGTLNPDKIANQILKKIGKIALEYATKNKKN